MKESKKQVSLVLEMETDFDEFVLIKDLKDYLYGVYNDNVMVRGTHIKILDNKK